MHESAVPAWRVGQSKTRREVVPPGRCQGARHPWITREQPAFGRTGEHYRLLTRNDGLNFVVFFVPRRTDVVPQSVVEGQIGFHAPAVLGVQTEVVTAAVGRERFPLD